MAVVTRDGALKRAIRRLTTATGSSADFVDSSAALTRAERDIDLVVFDARGEDPSGKFYDTVPEDARIVFIISTDLPKRIHLLQDSRVCSLFFYDRRFDDNEFICAATKALRDELFGLQKYMPWGVTTFTMTVHNYTQKTRAVDFLARYAKLAGVRASVRDRIQLVVDELIMNAMYHAPVDSHGRPLYENQTLRELAQIDELEPVQIQYGCSGQYFGVAVRDGGGSLTRERTLEYLAKSGDETEIENKASGAGLGLVSVLQSVSKLVFNLDPGYSTEVIGLFDMELFAKGKVGARSLHLHVATETSEVYGKHAPGPSEESVVRAATITRRTPIPAAWMLAALLWVIVAGMATAYFTRSDSEAAEVSRTITVVPTPGDAFVEIDNQPTTPGTRTKLSSDRGSHEIRVTRDGYLPWSQTLSADEIDANFRLHVTLAPIPNQTAHD